VKEICGWAEKKGFTHVIVLAEKNKVCNRLLVSHLPAGPTALFKVTTVVTEAQLSNRANKTSHTPEILLNNFNTRLGHRVGRFLGSFFPHKPNLKGRQVGVR
jgi:ribosome production factor 1